MRKISKLLASTTAAISALLVSPIAVFAAEELGPIKLGPQGQFSKLGDITIVSLIAGGIRLVLVVAAILFFFILVIGGIQWIVSGGDKTGVETARKRITNALVGLAIVFVAWAIVTLINTLFGVDIFSLNIPTFQPGTQ